jgi:7,8-dihydropterin-6-yl-methyl-4-(beta-D-ribofuranosyl)aminobenzene 5'-phosphate synthase
VPSEMDHSRADVAITTAEIRASGPKLVALSGHDSTPWTYDAFARCFGDRYRTLRAGEALRITAADA